MQDTSPPQSALRPMLYWDGIVRFSERCLPNFAKTIERLAGDIADVPIALGGCLGRVGGPRRIRDVANVGLRIASRRPRQSDPAVARFHSARPRSGPPNAVDVRPSRLPLLA